MAAHVHLNGVSGVCTDAPEDSAVDTLEVNWYRLEVRKLTSKRARFEATSMPSFEYVFPAIRGIQAGRAYYVSICPLRLIPRIFLFDEDELRPELRAQRILNKTRIPEISRYIVRHPKDYTFSALTASIDGEVAF